MFERFSPGSMKAGSTVHGVAGSGEWESLLWVQCSSRMLLQAVMLAQAESRKLGPALSAAKNDMASMGLHVFSFELLCRVPR